jgi:hypothetical protein
LFSELTRRVNEEEHPNKEYLFASMSMAMLFRMVSDTLLDDFAHEAHEWKRMYASWNLDARLFLLRVLGGLDRKESRDCMYSWGADLFPEAQGMLDVARATGVHPALLLRQWYDERGAKNADSLAVDGLV